MFKMFFKLSGWKVTHFLSDEIKKCVIIVAPHTSNWDFIFGMGAVKEMKLRQRFAIKKEWIRFPVKTLMYSLGALPIDRNKTKDAAGKSSVEAMADLFSTRDVLRLVITPEGTRSRVEKWRTGFYYVALKANVPIALAFINYETKTCGIDKIIYPSGDFKADMKIIMDFYKNIRGGNPQNFSIDTELDKNVI
ncbi:MAG: 1-acyl-sn-glycerol-3-phosphate acyltransferase [Bacteroidetes bacterium]|nr:1-acyl-sn-glycerol-3-phosphate acyltransferase [Bacteroidota bacterium]